MPLGLTAELLKYLPFEEMRLRAARGDGREARSDKGGGHPEQALFIITHHGVELEFLIVRASTEEVRKASARAAMQRHGIQKGGNLRRDRNFMFRQRLSVAQGRKNERRAHACPPTSWAAACRAWSSHEGIKRPRTRTAAARKAGVKIVKKESWGPGAS